MYNFTFLICNIMYFNVNFVRNKNGQIFGRKLIPKPGALALYSESETLLYVETKLF